MPLELKLPVLMSGILTVVLTVTLVAVVTTLRTSALERVRERLDRGTRQLSTLASASVATQHARFLPVANDSAVRGALANPPAPGTVPRAVIATLSRLVLPTDSGLPAELWTADGQRIAFVGNDVRGSMAVAPGRPEVEDRIARIATPALRSRDSLRYGPLYEENGRVYFWLIMPVRERGRTLGYLAQQRRLAASPGAIRTLRELSGDSVSLYYHNVDGSQWALVSGQPLDVPMHTVVSNGMARDSLGDKVLYHEELIASTPIVVGMSISERAVLARPWRTIRTILLLSLLLLVGGIAAAWSIGRSVAGPLGTVRRAAGALAAGDYDARVPADGDVEVRRLAESFNHMAEEIGRSRSELEQRTTEAQEANRAKSEFLTTMSHELRTPLNAIGGYVDLLEMELRGPLTESQRKDLQRIKASQQHLLGLISGVLDLGRIEAGRVSYEPVHVALDPFLSGLDALVAPQAAAKDVTLDYSPSAPDIAAVADPEKLRQVLLNLISNAIRHTPPGGSVTLSAEERDGMVAILVEDTGPGIPPDKRDTIFEPFVQLDRSLTQTREGLGLGLAISRDLARGMSGELAVEDHAGGGARFVVTLPGGNIALAEPLTHTAEVRATAT